MTDIWSFLLQTLTASGAAVLLLIIKALFKDKLPPKWQLAVWGVLGIVLLMPAGIHGRYTLFRWQIPIGAVRIALGEIEAVKVLHPIPLIKSIPESAAEWAFAVYVCGVAVHLLTYALSYAALRVSLRRASPVDDESAVLIKSTAHRVGVKPCRAVRADGIKCAFICGALRPLLVLPTDSEVSEQVLMHELHHLKRKDTLLSIVICFFKSLHWCNPLLRYCASRALNDAESRCDAAVLDMLEGEQRREYGMALLSMANERYSKIPVTTCINNGGKNVSRRIEAIARYKKYPAGAGLVSVCTVIVLAMLLPFGGTATVSASRTDSLNMALSEALHTECTTPAGAFDTYAKALLEQNGLYLLSASPLSRHDDIAKKVSESYNGRIYGTMDSDFPSPPNAQEGYYLYNLKSEGKRYSALVVIILSYCPAPTLDDPAAIYLAYQRVNVYKEGSRWVATPDGDFSYVESALKDVEQGNRLLPHNDYIGKAGDFELTLSEQTVQIGRGHTRLSGDIFGFHTTFNTVPVPDADFTNLNQTFEVTFNYVGDIETAKDIELVSIHATTDEDEKQLDFNKETGSAVYSNNEIIINEMIINAAELEEPVTVGTFGAMGVTDVTRTDRYYKFDLYVNREPVGSGVLKAEAES